MTNSEFDRLLVSPADAFRREHWMRHVEARQRLSKSLETYLAEEACVGGVPTDPLGLSPFLDCLGDVYVKLLKCELAGHRDRKESIECMRAFAIVFSSYWACLRNACLAIDHAESSAIPIDEAALKQFLDDSSIRLRGDDEVIHLGKLLTDSFAKAYSEAMAASSSKNIKEVHHHTEMMERFINELLFLAQYMEFRPTEKYTEYELLKSGN